MLPFVVSPFVDCSYPNSSCLPTFGLLFIFTYPVDPRHVVPHFSVDSREVGVGAADTPGHNALREAIGDRGTGPPQSPCGQTRQETFGIIAIWRIRFDFFLDWAKICSWGQVKSVFVVLC